MQQRAHGQSDGAPSPNHAHHDFAPPHSRFLVNTLPSTPFSCILASSQRQQLDASSAEAGGAAGNGQQQQQEKQPQQHIEISKPADAEFVASLVRDVSAWLAEGAGDRFDLPPVNAYLRRIQHEQLTLDQFDAAAPPGFFVEVLRCAGHKIPSTDPGTTGAYCFVPSALPARRCMGTHMHTNVVSAASSLCQQGV